MTRCNHYEVLPENMYEARELSLREERAERRMQAARRARAQERADKKMYLSNLLALVVILAAYLYWSTGRCSAETCMAFCYGAVGWTTVALIAWGWRRWLAGREVEGLEND
jgi:hypothetical protein